MKNDVKGHNTQTTHTCDYNGFEVRKIEFRSFTGVAHML